jgi:hypothetical protein
VGREDLTISYSFPFRGVNDKDLALLIPSENRKGYAGGEGLGVLWSLICLYIPQARTKNEDYINA